MTAVPALLAPIRERERAACDYPGHATVEQSQADIPRLLAALDGVLALADAYESKAQDFDTKSDRFIPGEVRSRYQNMAEDEREHANAIRAAVVAALHEGES